MKRTNHLQTVLGIVAAVALSFSAASTQANNLLGIDVSSYQGFITWSSVYGDGVRFAFAKSTEGTTFTDTDFAGNMTRGKAAGIQMGAYHFAHPSLNCPSAEVNYFWSKAGPYILKDGKSLSPAVDFEDFGGVACGLGNYTAWFNKFNTLVQKKTTNSLNCVLIVSCCGACNLTTNITLGSWLANYNGQNLFTGNPWSTCCNCNPWDPTGSCNSPNWDYWQVSSTGAISGISGNVDLDAYHGTLSQLKSDQGIGGI